MIVNKSKVELSIQDFSECPGRDRVLNILEKTIGRQNIEFVDIPDYYWINDLDAMVFKLLLTGNSLSDTALAAAAGVFANRIIADEFDYLIWKDEIIIRVWWD